MEKRSKKRNRKDSVSITKIYETIKDKGFMQELWLDVMSDLKQKPSYIRLKGMVEKVIESAVDNYATKPKDHEERLKTRTIFTDLSIMTYTIDTLISELLRKKLKDEFKTIISNIVDELKNKPESSHAQKNNNPVQMLEGIGEMLCNGVDKESINQTAPIQRKSYTAALKLSIVKKAIEIGNRAAAREFQVDERCIRRWKSEQEELEKMPKNKRARRTGARARPVLEENLEKWTIEQREKQESASAMNVNEHNSNYDTVDLSCIKTENSSPRTDEHSVDFPDSATIAFSIVQTESMSNTNNTSKNVTTNLMSCMSSTKKGSPKKVRIKKKKVKKHLSKKSSALSSDEDEEVDVVNVSGEDMSEDSNFSLRSASSVHTSDLSSFEDTISISSEDEQGGKIKRHVPFKDAYELCVNGGRIEDLHDVSHNKRNITYSPKSSMPVNSSNESPKRLPTTRIRKPNSKYSSDDVICSMKHLNSIIDSPPSVNSFKSDRYDVKRNTAVSHSDSPKKRGRPPKNKNTEVEEKVVNVKLSNNANKIDDVYSPSIHTSTHKIEITRKRGRPPKNIPQICTNEGNKDFNAVSSSSSEEDLPPKYSFNKSTSPKAKQETSNRDEPKVKRRRGRPSSNASKGASNNDSFKHTVESFTSLEERLSVKDLAPLSPSKSSTKSYVTSDLYKPRSDFRGCFDSRGNSRAITLFSN